MALPVSYHWRSLFVRRTTTLLTVLVVAAVVGVFTWMISFAGALRESLSMARDDRKIIVLRHGATAESNSAIPVEDFNRLTQLADVAKDPTTGEPLISPEAVVQVSLPRVRDGGKTFANVAVRGVTETAFQVHRNVKPLDRIFAPGSREVIVGLSTARQFAGLDVGQTLKLGYGGDRDYTVVGHFSADGGPSESEIWGYLPSMMNSYQRTMYSSAGLRVADNADPSTVIEQIEGPAIQLAAQTEGEYWGEQSKFIRVYLIIAYLLVTVMSLAAILSIAITMFASVAGRTQEIAMLRTIGYSQGQIRLGFLVEAVLLSLIGGLLGCLACAGWLALMGNTKDMFGATTFTTLAFKIDMSPTVMAIALASVAVVGVLGALFPAIRASRLQVVAALREA